MKVSVRKIGNGYGILLPKRVIHRLGLAEGNVLNLPETAAGIELSAFVSNFSEQIEAFRRTGPRHRNTYRKLAK
ncbi:MAG: hypothetical protein WBM04_19340 [Candidatus Korobacteraceae bacterium]